MTPSDRVLSMIEALNRGDIDAAMAHFEAEDKNHGQRVGQAGMGRVFEAQRLVFPDWHHEVVQTISAGSTVVTRSFLSGTHGGTLGEPMVSLTSTAPFVAWTLADGPCGFRLFTSGRSATTD